MKHKTGIFSFFSGAGFLDLGFEKSGNYTTLLANEFHKPFNDIYKSTRAYLNIDEPEYGNHVHDIEAFLCDKKRTFLHESIEAARAKFDEIGFIGGPPCPDFSIGGKNKGKNGENGKLSATYIELITSNLPDFFLFENVKGLYRTKRHREFFNSLKKKLLSKGYHLTERVINSLEYGVPQDRERIILIGFHESYLVDSKVKISSRRELKNFPWQAEIKYDVSKILSKNWPKIENFEENSVKPCPSSVNKKLTVEFWFQKNKVSNHANAEHYFKPRAGLPKFQTIPEGDDLKKSYKRLHRWRYSPTAAYGNNEVHLHPYKARRISVAEALAIQSLPKEYSIPEHVSLTNMFKTIGNGVPFLAAQGLAKTITRYLTYLQSGGGYA